MAPGGGGERQFIECSKQNGDSAVFSVAQSCLLCYRVRMTDCVVADGNHDSPDVIKVSACTTSVVYTTLLCCLIIQRTHLVLSFLNG